MKQILLIAALFFLSNFSVAQEFIPKINIGTAPTKSNSAEKTEILVAVLLNKATPLKNTDSKSLAIVTPFKPKAKTEKTLFSNFNSFKETKNLIYENQVEQEKISQIAQQVKIKSSIFANKGDYSAPLDNSIAVSDNGYLISTTNDVIEIYQNSILKYRRNLAGFFENKIGAPCDPKVIFDPIVKKFIVFAQSNDGNYSKSKIIIGFSISNNPIDGWNFYTLPGNPLNKPNQWFDYPKLGISKDGVFISGNIYKNLGNPDSNQFIQTVVYHIDKSLGFSGQNLKYRVWYNIYDSPAIILPVSTGFQGEYGPGAYLLSTDWSNNNISYIKLYDVTGDIYSANSSMNYYKVPTAPIKYFATADQMDKKIDNGDIRIQDGFYTGNEIIYVFTSGNERNFSRINLNVLELPSLKNKSKLIGDQLNYSYAYPSVAAISEKNEPIRFIIQYNGTSNQSFPDIRYKLCDNSFTESGEMILKDGENIIEGYDRWGDYTTISKNFFSKNDIWLTSSYGSKAGIRQTVINNLVLDKQVDSTELQKLINNKSFTFQIGNKKRIEVFLNSASEMKKIFDGTVWKGARSLNIITDNLGKGNYNLKIVDKNTKHIINQYAFVIKE